MPKLIIQGPGGEYSVDLKEGANTLGRSSKCTFPLNDSNCSREHVAFEQVGAKWVVRDMGSMNGTLVNGNKIQADHILSPGDRVTIGTTHINYETVKGRTTTPSSEGPKPTPGQSGVGTMKMSESEVKRKAAVGTSTPPPGSEPKPTTERKKRTRAIKTAGALVKDFAVWTPDSGPWASRAIMVLVLGVAVVIAFVVVRGLFSGGGGVDDDANNLIRTDASFETSANVWHVAGDRSSSVSIERSVAKHGKASLVLDKSGEPSDLVVDCLHARDVALDTARTIEASVWARSDGFSGWAAVKIEWLNRKNGSVLLEEYSELGTPGSDWTRIQGSFTAPEGAGAFRVGLSAVGRKGRIFFDDVRVYGSPGTSRAAQRFNEFTLQMTGDGVFSVSSSRDKLIANTHMVLWSNQNGGMPQMLATTEEAVVEEDRIKVKGRLISPVDFREIEFEQTIVKGESELTLVYAFEASELQQIDRVLIRTNLPTGSTVEGIPEESVEGTVQVRVPMGDAGMAFEHEVVEARTGVSGGITVLEHRYPITQTVGYNFRYAKGGLSEKDPKKAASDAERSGRPGDALDILVRYAPTLRDPRDRAVVEKRIEKLRKQEQDEWDKAQRQAFLAELSRSEEDVNDALEALSDYARSWPTADFAGKAAPLQKLLTSQLEDAKNRDRSARAKRILEQAKNYAAAGWTNVARDLLTLIQSNYGDTDVAEQAAEMERQLRGEE